MEPRPSTSSKPCCSGRLKTVVAPPTRVRRPPCLLSGALILAVVMGCEPELVSLPEVDDSVFTRLADIRLGMRQRELLRKRPSIEASQEGELEEAEGVWWITYGVQHPQEPRLTSVRLWREFTDSLSLRDHREGLVASLSSAYGFDPECYREGFEHLDEIRFVWRGRPNTGLSSQVIPSPDGRGYLAELVVLVRLADLPLHSKPVPCGELGLEL